MLIAAYLQSFLATDLTQPILMPQKKTAQHDIHRRLSFQCCNEVCQIYILYYAVLLGGQSRCLNFFKATSLPAQCCLRFLLPDEDEVDARQWECGLNAGPFLARRNAPALEQTQVILVNTYLNLRKLGQSELTHICASLPAADKKARHRLNAGTASAPSWVCWPSCCQFPSS